MFGRFIVWHNLNKDTYYFKFVKHSYYDYKIGLINQYNHEVILIINLCDYITIRCNFVDYRRAFITNLQKALEKLK